MRGDELPSSSDYLIVGAGIVGLSVARELRRRHPDATIAVLDKERELARHASGRNSGVLHAGFYYTADSLKAKLTRQGNQRLRAWCEAHEVPLRPTGKLVVARSRREHRGLDELLRRGEHNGVPLEAIDADEARRIEPRATTCERALWSPSTASFSPRQIMATLADELRAQGVALCLGVRWLDARHRGAHTDRGPVACGYLVNAAGLYADRVARAYGFGEHYTMLPFKGLYLRGETSAPALRCHIYPVPDLAMPFLGVHLTVTSDGRLKIGPTALPALWREQYGRPGRAGFLAGFDRTDLGEIAKHELGMLLRDESFRGLAFRELGTMWRRTLVREAAKLCEGLELAAFRHWAPSGIRAQLFDRKQRKLVMDFCFEHDDHSLHVLNAVSPAFTCAFAFAELLVDAIEGKAERSGGTVEANIP
jgi:L-2-hydroxyglutarate oxidase LhgO